MPKWSVNVYFSACKTVEVEADSWLEARKKGLEIVEDPAEEDFYVLAETVYDVVNPSKTIFTFVDTETDDVSLASAACPLVDNQHVAL